MSADDEAVPQLEAVFNDFIVDTPEGRRLEVDVDGRRHTVPIREPHSFEIDIVDDLIEPQTDTSVSGNAQPVKGRWIHGWLSVNQDDYINNIFKNYQFFLKYLEARTAVIKNISTYQRSPGTYDSMYRYLLLLEDLGLVERYRREEVPEDEYDFPVPDEFRTRTYLKKTADYEDRRESWDNPYEALYPGGSKEDTESSDEEDDELDEDDAVEIEVEPEEPEGESDGLEGFIEPGEGGPTDIEPSDAPKEEPSGMDEMADVSAELPDEDASIADFPQRQNLIVFIRDHFSDALTKAIENSPVPMTNVTPDDFSMGRVAVFGPWAESDATPGETELSMVVSVDSTSAEISPGFIPTGIQTELENVLNQENPYPDVFPSYTVVGVYNGAFKRKVDEVVRQTQETEQYFNLTEGETETL
jgi:hypothetical protein